MALEVPFASGDTQRNYAFGGEFKTAGTPVSHNAGDPPYIPMVHGPSKRIEGVMGSSEEVAIVSIGPDKYYH